MGCFQIFDQVYSLHRKLLWYESSTCLRRVWQELLFYHWSLGNMSWLSSPHTFASYTLYVSRPGSNWWQMSWKPTPFSHTENAVWASTPPWTSGHLFPSPRLSRTAYWPTARLPERNKRTTPVLTNGFHLKALLNCFSLFMITGYLFSMTICHFGQMTLTGLKTPDTVL